MLAMLFLMFGMYFNSMLSKHAAFEMQFSARHATPIASSLIFYQNEATTACYNVATNKITCAAGQIALPNRTGSEPNMAYGKAFRSYTDGQNFIATTLIGPTVGGIPINKKGLDWLLDSLNKQMSYSVTVGYYNAESEQIVLSNTGSSQVQQERFTGQLPGQLYDGQPILLNNYTHEDLIGP